MDPILYVGDSFDIKQVLNESGKKIDAVQNGMIALNALSDSANKYSAVIIEDQLPLMDPSNLIKQLEHYSKTPIIAIVSAPNKVPIIVPRPPKRFVPPKTTAAITSSSNITPAFDDPLPNMGLPQVRPELRTHCLLYTSDAADE